MKMNKLIIMSVCLALALILGLTLAWPQYQALQVLRFNIQAKELELQSKQAYFSAVKETAQQLEGYGDVLAKIASALPETPSLPSLFIYVMNASFAFGIASLTTSGSRSCFPQ